MITNTEFYIINFDILWSAIGYNLCRIVTILNSCKEHYLELILSLPFRKYGIINKSQKIQGQLFHFTGDKNYLFNQIIRLNSTLYFMFCYMFT